MFNISERLSRISEKVGASQLIKQTGIPRGTFYGYLSGRTAPSAKNLATIAELTGTDIGWLITGKGSCEKNDDYVAVSLYAVEASAGSGVYPSDYPLNTKIMFRRDWIQKHGHEGEMFVLYAAGDSMVPTIKDGDIVLIKQLQTIEAPAIYAFRHGDVLRIKRLELGGKYVQVNSDNARYAPEKLPAEEVKIFGRAIWAGGEL